MAAMPKTAPEILATLTLAVLAWLIVAGAVLAGWRRWRRRRVRAVARESRALVLALPPGDPLTNQVFEDMIKFQYKQSPLWSAFDIPTDRRPEG